jgi:hypothetical protein
MTPSSQKTLELIHREPGLPNDRAQSTLRDLRVVGYGQAPVRGHTLPEHDVTAILPIPFITEPAQSFDDLST